MAYEAGDADTLALPAFAPPGRLVWLADKKTPQRGVLVLRLVPQLFAAKLLLRVFHHRSEALLLQGTQRAGRDVQCDVTTFFRQEDALLVHVGLKGPAGLAV